MRSRAGWCGTPGRHDRRDSTALSRMSPLGCVTGRFQPVHAQHLALFDIALAECRHLIVALTNPHTEAHHAEPTSEHRHTASANPFTYFERARLVDAAVRERGWAGRVTIVPFDLTRPALWPQFVPSSARQFVRAYGDWEREKARRFERAGYAVTLLDGDPATRLSASEIRAGLQSGDTRWHALVPAATIPLLDAWVQRATQGEPP